MVNKWSGFNLPGQLKQVCIRTITRQNVPAGLLIIYPPKYALLTASFASSASPVSESTTWPFSST
ncbi:hypothetical protein SGB_00892 [Shigella boydii ATCC 9905]|nr:hypothetical protein SGB_00892 [Shigella boydii ATCC 9905]